MHPFARWTKTYTKIAAAVVAIPQIIFGLVLIGAAASLTWRALMDSRHGIHIFLGCTALFSFGCGCHLVFTRLPAITPRRPHPGPGRSRLAKRAELKDGDLFSDQGIYLGRTKFGDHAYFSGQSHALTFGPSRSGKDTRLIIPTLATTKRSALVIDPKGEVAAVTARARAKFSKVVMINPFGVLTDTHPHLKSHGFNPSRLEGFNIHNPNFHGNCVSLTNSLIKVQGEGNAVHFCLRARQIFSALFMWENFKNGPKANLVNAVRMLSLPYLDARKDQEPIGLNKEIIDMMTCGFDPIASKIGSFLEPNDETRDAIATAIAQTEFLTISPLMFEDLSKGGFDFAALKHECMTVYIILPANELDSHSNWLRMVVGCALKALMNGVPTKNRPLFILNECATLGSLDQLATAMGIAAGFGVQLWLIFQSLGQLQHLYKQNFQTFMGSRGLLNSFACRDMATAKYLSELAGNKAEFATTYVADPAGGPGVRTESPQGYPLIRPEDLTRLPPGQLLTFAEGVEYPFLCDASGYWETEFAHGLDPNPYHETPKPQRNSLPPPSRAHHRMSLDELHRRRRK